MTATDFEFLQDGTGVINGGPSGSALLHSGLTSPLAGEGSYCREFSLTSGTNTKTTISLSSSADGGAYYEIPNTKSISLRAWVRATSVFSSNCAIGITAKLEPNATDTTNRTTSVPRGYSLVLGDTADLGPLAFLRLFCDSKFGTISIDTTPIAVSQNAWIKIRMDVIPDGTQDIIKIYSGTGATGSEVWTLEYTKVVFNTDNFYIPWGETGAGQVGFFTVLPNTSYDTYIDRFQVFLEDV